MKLLQLAVTCLAVLWPVSAPALTRFEFEQALFSEPPQNVMDHCVVQENGVYHLFYLRGNPAVNIGHATTTDFVHWQTLDPVVPAGNWDTRVWAPFLVEHNGAWLMYYTGVNTMAAQQSGIALSTNLDQWFKLPSPVYSPSPSWAVWSSSQFSHGRDPHVIEVNGVYYMFVTAQHQWYKGAVGCAMSTDLVNWTDAGFIYMHTNWHMLESVFMLHRDGRFHMFFTEEGVGGTSHMSSATLFGGWDIGTRLYIDAGHAPQITDTPSGPIFSRHSVYNDLHGGLRYVLRFSPMYWSGNTPSVPKTFPLVSTWNFIQGDAFLYQPTFLHNAAIRNETYPASFVGDGWINTNELYTGPIGYGGPGQQQGPTRTGIIRSSPFTIVGNSISLLVGGGDYPDACYVALVDAGTSEVLRRETGRNSNVMDRRYWDVSGLIGRSVYIEIADLATGTFGHICVDDILESGNRVTPTTGGTGQGTGKKHTGQNLSQDAKAPAVARLVGNTPNPFNPRTTIRFELPGTARARVDMYDAAGALVRTLIDETRGPGAHTVDWDGTDRFGRSVASGVYFARFQADGVLVDTRKMMLLK
jgi:predicted GH43/DUF377 family glycosyl hydrolase